MLPLGGNLHTQLQRSEIFWRARSRAIEFRESLVVLAELCKLRGELHPYIPLTRPALQISRQLRRSFLDLFLCNQSLRQPDMRLPQCCSLRVGRQCLPINRFSLAHTPSAEQYMPQRRPDTRVLVIQFSRRFELIDCQLQFPVFFESCAQ